MCRWQQTQDWVITSQNDKRTSSPPSTNKKLEKSQEDGYIYITDVSRYAPHLEKTRHEDFKPVPAGRRPRTQHNTADIQIIKGDCSILFDLKNDASLSLQFRLITKNVTYSKCIASRSDFSYISDTIKPSAITHYNTLTYAQPTITAKITSVLTILRHKRDSRKPKYRLKRHGIQKLITCLRQVKQHGTMGISSK